jgi:hypothetical protein
LLETNVPENPDVLYDSIAAADPSQEVVGLQQKMLFMRRWEQLRR